MNAITCKAARLALERGSAKCLAYSSNKQSIRARFGTLSPSASRSGAILRFRLSSMDENRAIACTVAQRPSDLTCSVSKENTRVCSG